ncbi:SDR family NAD(P)-dependent oxidoreductase [Streptomyces asiaticus]
MHYIDPEHTRVLITGATSGVGEATAKLFAARGAAAVALLGRRPEELSRVADEIGDRAHTFRVDVSDSVSATDAVRAAVEGIDTNLSGMFYVSREAGLHMRAAGRGAIVNVASDLASMGVAGLAHYSAAKAGVVGLSRALAIELAPTVRVNVVSPGPVDTPMLRGGLDASAPEASLREKEATVPLKRLAHPDEIARAIWFLAIDGAFATGTSMALDGGTTAA